MAKHLSFPNAPTVLCDRMPLPANLGRHRWYRSGRKRRTQGSSKLKSPILVMTAVGVVELQALVLFRSLSMADPDSRSLQILQSL